PFFSPIDDGEILLRPWRLLSLHGVFTDARNLVHTCTMSAAMVVQGRFEGCVLSPVESSFSLV
ncbi:hypothetical protein Dimus_001623, partial [Dionaea muscipula]